MPIKRLTLNRETLSALSLRDTHTIQAGMLPITTPEDYCSTKTCIFSDCTFGGSQGCPSGQYSCLSNCTRNKLC
jgi:hypothetical protein